MPRYYIHLRNGEADVTDREGRELPDLEAVRRHALRAAGEIVADEMAQGRDNVRLVMTVTDEAGEPLLELPVKVLAG